MLCFVLFVVLYFCSGVNSVCVIKGDYTYNFFFKIFSWLAHFYSFTWNLNCKLLKYFIFNPLLPIAHKSARIDKISILKLEGIIKKSYERRDYESVDEKSLSKAMSRKTTKKRIQALKG